MLISHFPSNLLISLMHPKSLFLQEIIASFSLLLLFTYACPNIQGFLNLLSFFVKFALNI